MKQFTSNDQTAKLIELGFEKPSPSFYQNGVTWIKCEGNYSIGELIEMLPKSLKNRYNPPLAIEWNEAWRVYYGVQEDYYLEWLIWYEEERNELIDALYDMIVKLKEKGEI